IASNLRLISHWLANEKFALWGDVAARVAVELDGETREQFNSLLLDLAPEFCDVIAPYFKIGASRERIIDPAMTVAQVRSILRRNYSWALRVARTLAATHQHLWYHSQDNGEQRRGERIIDPHEQSESFIDPIGLLQRRAAVLTSYSDDSCAGDVVLD